MKAFLHTYKVLNYLLLALVLNNFIVAHLNGKLLLAFIAAATIITVLIMLIKEHKWLMPVTFSGLDLIC